MMKPLFTLSSSYSLTYHANQVQYHLTSRQNQSRPKKRNTTGQRLRPQNQGSKHGQWTCHPPAQTIPIHNRTKSSFSQSNLSQNILASTACSCILHDSPVSSSISECLKILKVDKLRPMILSTVLPMQEKICHKHMTVNEKEAISIFNLEKHKLYNIIVSTIHPRQMYSTARRHNLIQVEGSTKREKQKRM